MMIQDMHTFMSLESNPSYNTDLQSELTCSQKYVEKKWADSAVSNAARKKFKQTQSHAHLDTIFMSGPWDVSETGGCGKHRLPLMWTHLETDPNANIEVPVLMTK